MLKSGILLLVYCLGVCTVLNAATIPEETEKGKQVITEGLLTAIDLLNHSKIAVDRLDGAMKVAQDTIISLKVQSDSLDVTNFQYTKNFLRNYDETKNNLNIVKRELVSLASKLILQSKQIQNSLDNWQNEYGNILIKAQFRQLTRVIKETKEKLKDVENKILEFNAGIIIPKETTDFEKLLILAQKEEREEYKLWTDIIKEEYKNNNNNSGPVSLGSVIQAFADCSDQCGGVKTITAWIDEGNNVEESIENYSSEIKKYKAALKKAYRGFGYLDQASVVTITRLQQIAEKADGWLKKSEKIRKIINNFINDENDKKVILAFKNAFEEKTRLLMLEAQSFFDSATES